MEIAGWLVWALFTAFSLNCLRIIFGVNGYGERGLDLVVQRRVPAFLTFLDGLVGLVVAVAFLLYPVNRLHLLWAGPAVVLGILVLGRIGVVLGILR